MPPSYRIPARVTLAVLRDALLGRRRSFLRDSVALARGIRTLRILGAPPRDPAGALFLVNHYSRPGFRAWWIVVALVAAVRREMHWPMTAAWTYPDPLRARLITPVSERVLARLARMYGFTSMPPMPPRPEDAAARAAAVRKVLRLARAGRIPIGLAPEGMDSPDGALISPPPGAGRFIARLVDAGYTPFPVGVYEEGGCFCVRFGAPVDFGSPGGKGDDRALSAQAMRAVAALLPERLRGIYS